MQPSQSRGLKTALSNRSPRAVSVVALLALVPVALFALGRSALAVVALVNVLLIFGSLYLVTAPTEGRESGSHGSADTDTEASESTV